jgi:hypothetical protein
MADDDVQKLRIEAAHITGELTLLKAALGRSDISEAERRDIAQQVAGLGFVAEALRRRIDRVYDEGAT